MFVFVRVLDLTQGPDGGWGWVVVAASFICLCVLDGAAYTFGIFLDPLIEEVLYTCTLALSDNQI